MIRAVTAEVAGADAAAAMRIQYGGSVKPANAKRLMGMAGSDGALVGGASTRPDEFARSSVPQPPGLTARSCGVHPRIAARHPLTGEAIMGVGSAVFNRGGASRPCRRS
ncbi:MAG: triose-phosphate isomerase [Acidimicrobiales bacterium]